MKKYEIYRYILAKTKNIPDLKICYCFPRVQIGNLQKIPVFMRVPKIPAIISNKVSRFAYGFIFSILLGSRSIPAESATTGGKCILKWWKHVCHQKSIAHSSSCITQRLMAATVTLQDQAYCAAIDYTHREAVDKEVDMLHEDTNSGRELVEEAKNRFYVS